MNRLICLGFSFSQAGNCCLWIRSHRTPEAAKPTARGVLKSFHEAEKQGSRPRHEQKEPLGGLYPRPCSRAEALRYRGNGTAG
ncbi:MAG: hypothetical protein WCA08_06595 [Desulfoferrobacter sp.]